jgi:Putative Actinobacterial Holin-X, holin superfamily III
MGRAEAGGPSARELAVRLGGQLSALVREELALAKAELFASARQAILGGVLLATAAVLGLTGWLALVAAAIAGLASALPLWASALITGGALVLLAGALAALGRARLARGTPPLAMTAASVREGIAELTGRDGAR